MFSRENCCKLGTVLSRWAWGNRREITLRMNALFFLFLRQKRPITIAYLLSCKHHQPLLLPCKKLCIIKNNDCFCHQFLEFFLLSILLNDIVIVLCTTSAFINKAAKLTASCRAAIKTGSNYGWQASITIDIVCLNSFYHHH